MSGYSSIFASGLLATPRPYRTAESARASSPDIDMAIDTTPTNSKAPLSMYISGAPADADEDYFSPSRSRASSSASSTGPIPQPRLRRRRSSLTVATGAMGAIKSPLRSAGVAFQRTALTPATAGRARSGSVDMLAGMEDFGSTPNPHTGRMRSGSVGGAFNRPTRRTGAVRKPPTAPPTVPLPLPPSSAPVSETVFRRPLSHRAHTTDNYKSFGATLGLASFNTYLTSDFTNKLVAAMDTPPPVDGSVFWAGGMKEN